MWRALLPALTSLVLPVVALLAAPRGHAFGRMSVDLAGHLWTGWRAAREPWTTTRLVAWPDGLDLLPVVGGWLDVAAVALLEPVVGLVMAWNLVVAGTLLLAGLGGAALARAVGARPWAAAAAGLLLQLDGFVLHHLMWGRTEQVGLGWLALALAAALARWRGRLGALPTAVAGASLLFASWELSLVAVGLLGVAGPTLWATTDPEKRGAAARRWATAAAGCGVLTGGFVATFLARTAASRSLDDGPFALELAAEQSVGLLGWLTPGQPRASWAALAALAVAPLVLRGDRRRWAVVAGVLGLTLALALGPWPGLWAPGAPEGEPWGPFAALQALPLLAWYHWPDRLLVVVGLAAVAAAGLLVDRMADRSRAGAVALGLALVGGALAEQAAAGHLPRAEVGLPDRPGPRALAALEGPGAVLDLPVMADPAFHVRYALDQITHGRPLLLHHMAAHLDDGASLARARSDRTLLWLTQVSLTGSPPAPPTAADWAQLRAERGFRFVVAHPRGWERPERARAARGALEAALGPPVAQDRSGWTAWELPAAPPEGP